MGELQCRAAKQLHSRGNPLLHGAFRGTNWRIDPGMEIVCLQIHLTHEPPADHTGGQRALNVNKAPAIGAEQSLLQIFLHMPVTGFNAFLSSPLTQQSFGKNHVIGRGRVSDEIPDALPIFRLRGILIAGNASPFCHGAMLGN